MRGCSDGIGRRTLFTIDIARFVVLGLLQAVVTEPWQLVVVRLLLGVAVGAEYALGAALLSRLMHRGRVDEARAIADRYLGGDDYFLEEELEEQEDAKACAGGLKRLFEPGMRGRTLFVCTFYACNVAPCFAIFTFAPQVFAALQINNEAASTILANAIAVVGALVGMLTIERIGRRQQLIGPFWVAHGAGDDRLVAEPHRDVAPGDRVTARSPAPSSTCRAVSLIDRRNVGVNVCLT